MIDIEVDGPKLKEESTIFGFINLPRVPMIRIHKYILLVLGAALVTWDICRQLPADLSDLENANLDHIDPNTWFAFPFIMMAYLFGEKQTFIKVCRQFRMIALQEKNTITEYELNLMVRQAMTKLLPRRLFDALYVVITWFLLFNLMMLGALYLMGA